MPEFSTTRRVRHSAADMFDLVADVEKYPQFVPLCSALRVRDRKRAVEGVEVLIADMTVAYKLISETFKSRTLGMLMGAMFETAFRRFSTAFEQRADKVYGVSGA